MVHPGDFGHPAFPSRTLQHHHPLQTITTRCSGLTSRDDAYRVPTMNHGRASHNRSLSDGDHGSVGRGYRSGSNGNNLAVRRFRWTEELKEDLMVCWQDSEPTQLGYMARIHDLWCIMHPEYAHFSAQRLRNQACYLRRQGYDLLLVPRRLSVARSSRISTRSDNSLPERPVQEHHELPERTSRDVDTRRSKITGKFRIRPEQLALANEELTAILPADVDLLDLNWAVYETARDLKPQSPRMGSYEVKMRRRIAQLQGKIEEARKHASQIQCVIDFITNGRSFTARIRKICANLRYHHHTLNKTILLMIKERFVEKVRVLGTAKRSLEKRLRRLVENSLFHSDPNRWFEPPAPMPDKMPSVEQVEEFWGRLYGEVPDLMRETPALRKFREACQENPGQHAEFIPVTQEEVKKVLRGMKNHAAPGPDGINAFWWKRFSSVYSHLARIFTSYIDGSTPIPEWLVVGRTVLIPKKGDLSNPANYRPITCLNTLYKLFTGVLNERILHDIHPMWQRIYAQRGAKRALSGCKESLLVDRCVLRDSIQYHRNLSVAWVDYRKAFDSTSHELMFLLLECLGVEGNVVRCLKDLAPLWRTRFTITSGGGQLTSGLVQYRRGVFQGDTLSPLLFCISLMPISVALDHVGGYKAGKSMLGDADHRKHKISHIFYMDDLKLFASNPRQLKLMLDVVAVYSRAVGMSFGLDKCAVLHMNRGKVGDGMEDMQLVDGSVIRHLGAEESYKYLGFNQQSVTDSGRVKQALREEYRRRLRKVWKSELSGKNKVAAANMFAVPVLLYSFGVLKWNRDELRQLDRDTRKLMNIHRSLHPRSSCSRLYFARDNGGRGLLSLECLHDRLVLGLACDVLNGTDPLMEFVHDHELHGLQAFLYKAADTAAGNFGLEFLCRDGVLADDSLAFKPKSRRRAMIKEAEQSILLRQHVDKPMHGAFFRHVEEQGLSVQLTFAFLKSAGLTSETESSICACQDGVFNTLVYQSRIMGMQVPDTRCRACKQSPETLMHLLSACPTYAITSYIHRHNAALRVLYYYLRHSYEIDRTPVLPYTPGDIETVVANEKCKIYWNFSFATTRVIRATRPDIVLFDFDDKVIYVIEFSAPAEANITTKEGEKRLKYQPLLMELRQLNRGFKVKIVVLIIGSLGGMKQSFVSDLEIIPACRRNATILAGQMQKAVILGSLRLLRQHDSGLQ